jgi:hypothetical protein
MKLFRFIWVVALVGLIAAPLRAMNNGDVIKMHKAELSEQTIMMAIANEPTDYDTSPDGLIELKKAGIPEAVIQKIVAIERGEEAPPAPPSDAPAPAPAPAGGTFFNQDFPSIAPPMISPTPGGDYFLRSSLYFEDEEYVGTNYARGTLVPINTPVKIDEIKKESIVAHRTDTGEKLEIKNVDKYTKKSITQLAGLLFSAEKTPLERLPDEMASAIRAGEMRKGMTKEQVLMTRGYPPAHETPSVQGDRWVYWSSRFVKQTIVFNNGRLSEGRGIY